MKPNSTMTRSASRPATARAQRKVLERMNCGWRIGSRRAKLLLNGPGNASLPATLWFGAKNEAGAADIVDHGNLARSIHLMAQAAHVYVNKVGRRNEFVIPDLLQKHGSRQQLIAPLHHIFKQAKLARQQIDRTVAALGGALDQVEFERPCPQCRLAGFRRPPQQRLQPGDK